MNDYQRAKYERHGNHYIEPKRGESMKTALSIILVFGLWLGLSALGAWILWLIYGVIAPAVGLPPVSFLIFWGITFLLKAVFGTTVTVHRD